MKNLLLILLVKNICEPRTLDQDIKRGEYIKKHLGVPPKSTSGPKAHQQSALDFLHSSVAYCLVAAEWEKSGCKEIRRRGVQLGVTRAAALTCDGN
jgi:hypothetical protein